MINLAVIPVAGRGTGLLPLTKSQPKEMLPVAGKPIVQYVVEELVYCGVSRCLFVTGAGKTAIENHFDINPELIEYLRRNGLEDNLLDLAFERSDAEYLYTRQRRQLGLGHAVLCSETFVRGENFVVALGDTIIGRNMKADVVSRMCRLFEESGGSISGVIAFAEVAPEEVGEYGIAMVGERHGDAFEVDDLIEKPSKEDAPGSLAVAARYVFNPLIFDYLRKTPPGVNDDIQLTDAVRLMLKDGRKILGVRLTDSEPRYDIGGFESYFKAFVDFALDDPEHGEALRSHLRHFL